MNLQFPQRPVPLVLAFVFALLYTPLPAIPAPVLLSPDRYDAENRLLDRHCLLNGKPSRIHFLDDADGNRVGKSVAVEEQDPATSTTRLVTTKATRYLVDQNNPTGDSQVSAEVERGKGAVMRVHLSGLRPVAEIEMAVGEEAQARYLVSDGHGSTRASVSATPAETQGAGATTSVVYDAFGNPVELQAKESGSSSWVTLDPMAAPVGFGLALPEHQYGGERYDPELGMIHLRARDYTPALGRFITADTFEGALLDPPTLHRYIYCRNSPLDRVDPSGFRDTMETGVATTVGMTIEALELSAVHALRRGLVTGTSGLILRAGAVAILGAVAVTTAAGTAVALRDLMKEPRTRSKLLFRAMAVADDGGPVVSNADGQYLGIRSRDLPNEREVYDIDSDRFGLVRPGTGGLSVTPGDPALIFSGVLRRVSSGQSSIFAAYEDAIPPSLAVRSTQPNHSLVEPAAVMSLSSYRDSIVRTRLLWSKVSQ